MATSFVRPSLRGALMDEIRKRILHGELEGSIVETALAEDLGVSRTPLREALITLERDGFLRYVQGAGFSLNPLTIREAEETYPLVGVLEGWALRLRGAVDDGTIDSLVRLTAEMDAHNGKPLELLRLDRQWHELLLGDCGNSKVLEVLARLKWQLNRYEYAYMSSAGAGRRSVQSHTGILGAIRRDDVTLAAARIEEHWSVGASLIAEWLRRSQKATGE